MEKNNLNDLLKLFSNTKSEFGKFVTEYLKAFDKAHHELEEVKKFPESINNLGDNPNLDLKTYEGYSQYMKNLGELRNMINQRGEYFNDIIKHFTGKTATEILDSIAKEVTNYYIENKAKEQKPTVNKEKCNCEESNNVKQCTHENKPSPKYKINNDEPNKNAVYVFPSERIDDEKYTHICNIVDKYMAEEVDKYFEMNDMPYDESFDSIYNELIEFACWLSGI